MVNCEPVSYDLYSFFIKPVSELIMEIELKMRNKILMKKEKENHILKLFTKKPSSITKKYISFCPWLFQLILLFYWWLTQGIRLYWFLNDLLTIFLLLLISMLHRIILSDWAVLCWLYLSCFRFLVWGKVNMRFQWILSLMILRQIDEIRVLKTLLA